MAATQQDRSALYNDNKFKLGLFAANCSSGRAATKVAERWSGSWEDNLQLAQMADEAGIDFMLPIGRWKGYRGETNFHGSILEPTIWAAGLLAYTKRICVFSTIHAPLIHPIVAAKQLATADLIGRGRMGMNGGGFGGGFLSQRQTDYQDLDDPRNNRTVLDYGDL